MDSNPANSSWPEAAELKRSLVERADSVADRSKFLVRRRAVFIWLTLVLAASSLLVLCDAFWQYDEKGLRLLAFLSLVTIAAYWLWKVVLPAWGFAPTKADAARWLDRRSGSKAQRNQALTLVELADLPNEDARFGSQDFRQVAIEQSVKRVAENNWDSVLNERPINGQSLALLAVLSAIALFFLVSPKRSWIGVQRLMLPLSSVQWPKSDLLDFRGLPDAVSLGTVLQVEVVDQVPPLPSRVELEIRYSDEPNQVLRQKMELVDDVAFSTLAQVQRSFEIRAVGGEDDSMPWRSVEVMRAPSFESFRFRVDPPEYANQDSFYLVSRRIQVLRGSRVQLSLTLTDAVTSVRMELQTDESGGDSVESQEVVRSEQRRPAMRMDALNRSLTIGGEDGWAANDALRWQFVVETQDGYSVRLPAIWSVDVVDDEVPSIAFAESEMPFLTSEGVLSLSGRATDDIELAEVSAVVSLQDSQSGQVISHRVNVWNSIDGSETAQELDLNFEVRPADFAELDGEGPITIWLEAVDSKGQKAKSSERVFSIKESSELVEALGDQMSELVEQLAAVVGAQRRNRILVQRVGKLVAETSLVGDQELESLFSASQVQDSISQQLDGDKGVTQGFQELAEFFEANAIQDSLQYNQIRSVAAALRRIANEEMTQAVNAAYAAHQFAKSANDSGEQVSSAQPLDLANAELLAVDTKLQGVLDSLNRSEASKRVREELQEILSTQRQLQEATTQLQLDILSEAPKTVVDANQLRISVEQQDLSRQLDALVQQASAMVDETEASADSLASVIQILNEKQTSAAMRLAAQRLATQQIVEAKQNQSQAIRDIEDALSISRDAANDSASRQADVLQSMGENLRALAERQRELAASIGRRDKSTQELLSAQQKLTSQLRQNREQSESQVQLDAFQNQLNELNSQQEAVEDAIRKESSSASAQANDVANALDALADDMFEQSQDVNDQNRRRQVQELVGRVESLVTQQAAHVANLEMADDSNSSNLLQLANEQDKIRNSAEQINKDVREVPAFGWTLQLASRDMLRSAAATRRRRLADARRTAARALDKLQMVLEALGSEQENRPSAQTNNADEQQSREGQMLPSVASIRLLRALQQSINEETQALNSRESQGENVTSFLSDLALEQQELGKQLEFILQAMKGNAR